MAGASFKLDSSQVERSLGTAIAKMQQTQGLMESIGEHLVSTTVQRFEDGKAPDGTPWKRSIRAEKEGGQTLVDNEILKGDINYSASPGQVHVGTNKEYAAIHQFGGEAGRNHSVTLPAREYLGFSEEDQKDVRAEIADHMAQSLGKK